MTIEKFSNYTARTNGGRSIKEATAEVEREIGVRRKIFDRWVAENKMSWMDAHDRLERMLSALHHLIEYSSELDKAAERNTNPPSVIATESPDFSIDTAPAEQAA